MPPLQIHSANWLTSPTVLQAHHQSSPHHHAYHKKFHDQEKYHPPLPITSQHVRNELQSNEYCGYCPKVPPMSNKNDPHEFLPNKTSRHQILATHQKTAPLVATASCPDSNTANELLARLKSLLVMLLVIFFAYRIANRVGVLPFLEGVGCFFSIFTNS